MAWYQPHLNTNVVHPSRFVLLQESCDRTLLPQRMEQLQLSVAELHEHCVDAVLGQWHLGAYCGPQHITVKSRGLLHIGDRDGNMVQAPQLPQWGRNAPMEGCGCRMCPQQHEMGTSGNTCRWINWLKHWELDVQIRLNFNSWFLKIKRKCPCSLTIYQ